MDKNIVVILKISAIVLFCIFLSFVYSINYAVGIFFAIFLTDFLDKWWWKS